MHGRNLDWNIPETLKDFVIDVDVYQVRRRRVMSFFPEARLRM
jgi:hypothetical protein